MLPVNINADPGIGITHRKHGISETDQYFEKDILYLHTHDMLTGLLNRNYFQNELRRLDACGKFPISVIVGDINGLRLINQVFGFDVGDRLLRKTAYSLVLAAEADSIAARWGEDEFAVILSETDETMATEICRKMVQTCSEIEESGITPSIALGNATQKYASENLSQIVLEAEGRMNRHKLLEPQSTQSSVITSLSKALFEKSLETEEHALRMLEMSKKFGKAIGLSMDELDELCLLSVLHDIGKIAIPDHILLKPEKLTGDEWKEMKKHSEIGCHIAASSNELSSIAPYILSHHERWDGSGYPQGLRGTEIPMLSRIIAVVDTYDVITHGRPYQDVISHNEALMEIKRCSGTQFAPDIAEAFCSIC
ncbi:MAG: diguanylate cyclase [Syntrophomonadaceae bacterium]|nr:diguanylate cyclase [Syntrophomonadaceae bacterium]